MRIKRIGVERARVKLVAVLTRVHDERDIYLIAKHGKALALIVPLDAAVSVRRPTRKSARKS